MKRSVYAVIIAVFVILIGLGYFFRGRGQSDDIQYKYTAVARGEVAQSIEATGQLVSLTQVDVKSKAGGIVEKLLVDVGSVVKQGQVIAYIDPTDTQSAYDQAEADYRSAKAREQQSLDQYQLQKQQSEIAIATAKATVQSAQIAAARAKVQYKEQPDLTQAAIQQAQAGYNGALAALKKLQEVTVPQMRSDEVGSVTQTKAQLASDKAQLITDQGLLAKGFISKNQYSKDQAQAAASQQAYDLAVQKSSTLEHEIKTTIAAQQAQVSQAKAQLDQAQTGTNNVTLQRQSYQAALNQVEQAKIGLRNAIANERNNEIRMQDVVSAQSSIVGANAAANNAKINLESTVVKAPRAGVVTTKYLEEGTIIPPGTSLFSQGTSLVQISDVSQLYVNCLVDEADISQVKTGQKVRVTTEAYKENPVWGKVDRIDPSAVTTNNVTTVLVRVHILPDPNRKVQLLPGMNATCEFMTLDKQNVLYVPSEAIQNGPDGAYVLVKSNDPDKPTKTPVQTGVSGDDDVEITSGLKEGQEVVTATINIKLDEAIQKQMAADAQGGGLAGGGRQGPKSYRTTTKKPAAGGASAGGSGANSTASTSTASSSTAKAPAKAAAPPPAPAKSSK